MRGVRSHDDGEAYTSTRIKHNMGAKPTTLSIFVIEEFESGGSPICHNLPMCGRYRLSRRKQIIEEHFDCDPWDENWSPRYNTAPTQSVPVIRQHPKEPVRQVLTMRWA